MAHEGKPVFGTEEWAAHNFNIMTGCQHDCTYCYAKTHALRYKQIENPDQWKTPVINQKMLNRKHGKKTGTIMFPTTHDIHPDGLQEAVKALISMLSAGNKVLLVSKPHYDCIKAICEACEPYKSQLLFRFSIGSPNDNDLRDWEPNAPALAERMAALAYAYEHGFQTSVSCEPLLCTPDRVVELVGMLRPFVNDAIWLGKMNYAAMRLKVNGHEDMIPQAKALENAWTDDAIKVIYSMYKDDPLLKWKESFKKVLGISVPVVKGLDV